MSRLTAAEYGSLDALPFAWWRRPEESQQVMTDATTGTKTDLPSRWQPLLRLRDIPIAIIVSVLSILLLVPVNGALPGVNIDLSWPYALADATVRHIPFGRDIVFTAGPLSSIYTRFVLPDQWIEITVIKAILVAAFCVAAVAMSRRSIRWVALAIPFLIANLVISDSFFLAAPWVIVPLAAASWRNQRWRTASLVMLSIVLGPLLLVKGTLAIPLAASIGAAALIVSRRSWLEALALPCATLASIVVAWLAVGQQLPDLLYYLQRGSYIAEGYNNAMSLFGDPTEIWVYLAGAGVLLVSQIVPRRAPLLPTIAAAVILFVAFKAGFVRHETVHANIAGGTLGLLGLLFFLYRGNIVSGIGLLAGVAAWIFISASYWPVDPASSWSRLTSALSNASDDIKGEVSDPGRFRRAFQESKAKVAAIAALPHTKGMVDLYPNDQELLLASNRDYYPRPVMQSYSAYTPDLAFLNARHLEGPHAPKTAFFAIQPIDGHYPAMDDGPSWPALLGQYRFLTFSDVYAVLERVEGASAGTIDPPASSGSYAFGEAIPVPEALPFVWATMQFHPTPLGRIASTLFKLPQLRIVVTTADGQTRAFRLIAGMATAGFLLSPTVTSARDFVALRSTATDALAGQRVATIMVQQEQAHELWGGRFDLQLAALRIPTDPAVDDVILGQLEVGPAVGELPVSGECTIDSVGGAPATTPPIMVTGRTVTVTGWGFVSTPSQGRDGGNLRIALTPDKGPTVYANARRQARPDVDAYFHLASATHAGFTAQVNLGAIDGRATLRVVQDGPTGPAACGPTIAIAR